MKPDVVVALFTELKRALESQNRSEVNRISAVLIDGRAPLGDRWRTIVTLMQHNGEYTLAHQAMALLVAAHGGIASTRFEQAALLAQTGRLQQAWETMQTVPETVPDRAGHAFILGSMAVNLGSAENATNHLLTALNANPQLGQAMLSLAVADRMEPGHPVATRIISADPTMKSANVQERAHYQYALGKIYVDQHDHDRAFDAFAAGAALVRGFRPYDGAADVQEASDCRSGFNTESIARIAAQVTVPTSRTIFVTGLPRSGTTLVEQILASHSAVIGGEELGKMPIVLRDVGGIELQRLEAYLSRDSADSLASLYLHLVAERFGTEGRVVDKSLNVSRHMGAIAALLPQAPIIWLRRNPLDCAWSAFRTYFLSGLDWSWDLEDIAHHFKLEDALFHHWTSLLDERVLVVDYEALVSDPEPQIRRLLAHCGLPEEAAVFEPHKTKRAVTTASVMQVRQPINTSAVDSAGPYRSHLKSFIEAYEG